MSLSSTSSTDTAPPSAQPRSGRLLTMVALSVAGIAISGYLTYVHLAHATPMCVVGAGCETVNASVYSAIAGVPVALLGLGLYGLLFILSLAALRGTESISSWAVLGAFGLALSGTLYSGYLTYIELFVLQALCAWCLTSAAIMTVIFALSTWTLLRPPGASDRQ